jgi:hypothetical protein
MATIVLLVSSCKKDKDNSTKNPTTCPESNIDDRDGQESQIDQWLGK